MRGDYVIRGAPSEGINMVLKRLPPVPSEGWYREGAFPSLSGVLPLVYTPIMVPSATYGTVRCSEP